MSPTLYSLCISAAVDSATGNKLSRKEYHVLPDHVLFDFYYKIYTNKRLCFLSMELENLTIFARLLKVSHKRRQLLQCFQTLIDHGSNLKKCLVDGYAKLVGKLEKVNLGAIDLGMSLGAFYSECGCFPEAQEILNIVEEMCTVDSSDVVLLRRLLDCYHRRIYVESLYYMFKEAKITLASATKTIKDLEELKSLPNLAGLYGNFSNLYVMRSEYKEAYNWAMKAIKLLNEDLPVRVIIQVLRQASRICVLKRRFSQAGVLIKQALILADQLYQTDKHPSYSDTLTDYAFYLLNTDDSQESVHVYKKALAVRREVFGKNNMRVAVAYEDLAYALYVNEYSTGKFFDACENAERAIKIMEKIVPKNHMAFASMKRIRALIMEEIAIDIREPYALATKNEYLKQSEALHKSALELYLSAFGERNVQTAKQYGNLGRIYQSMDQYEKAEKMHLQAIALKKDILGEDDYEVGMSLGHLASLYNFQMKRYRDAEALYLRSIQINLTLFGSSYSGLEYDYRGLINVYTELQDISELLVFTNLMRDWKFMRDSFHRILPAPQLMSLDDVVKEFLKLC